MLEFGTRQEVSWKADGECAVLKAQQAAGFVTLCYRYTRTHTHVRQYSCLCICSLSKFLIGLYPLVTQELHNLCHWNSSLRHEDVLGMVSVVCEETTGLFLLVRQAQTWPTREVALHFSVSVQRKGQEMVKKTKTNLTRESEFVTLPSASSDTSRGPHANHLRPNGSRAAETLPDEGEWSVWKVKPR